MVTEKDIETGGMIATAVSDEDPDHLITEHRGATMKATHIPRAETTERESERTDMVDEVVVNEMNASGTEIEVRVEETTEIGRLDATAIYSMIEEAVEETEVSEGAGMAAARIETSLRRKLEAAKRAHRRRRRRGSRHQI